MRLKAIFALMWKFDVNRLFISVPLYTMWLWKSCNTAYVLSSPHSFFCFLSKNISTFCELYSPVFYMMRCKALEVDWYVSEILPKVFVMILAINMNL